MNDSIETRLSLIGRLHNKGDGEAWSECVQIYEPLIQTFVQRRGLQHADAAEVTQEVLSRVANSIAQWSPDPLKGTFRGWLYRVTRNLTIDYIRRNKRLPTADGETDIGQIASPSEDDSREFRLEYERQLFNWAAGQVRASFKADNWLAFWLSSVEEKSVHDVAKQLNISRGTVYVARSRVMARIKSFIKERLEETADQ